jgi:hypothetical protein
MKTITINVFEFNELSDQAKDKAREWYRSGALDYEWWESVYDDAATIGLEIIGFDLDRNRHCQGRFFHDATEVADLILKNHGDTCDTYKLAEEFWKEHDRIVESAERDENGDFANERQLDDKLDDCEKEFFRAIREEYSLMLQKEYEYLLSDESVDESILCNGYTFDEYGNRKG